MHLGYTRGSAAPAEGVRAGGVRVQGAPRGAGEDSPGRPGGYDIREPLHPVHHGDATRRLGAAAHFHQPQHQRGREPDPHTRLQGNKAAGGPVCVRISKIERVGYRPETSLIRQFIYDFYIYVCRLFCNVSYF